MNNKRIKIILSSLASLFVLSGCFGGDSTPTSSYDELPSEEISSEVFSSEDYISEGSSSSSEEEPIIIDNKVYANLPFLKMSENSNILMSVSISDVLKVNFKVDNNINSGSLSFSSNNYELKADEDNIFSLKDIDPLQITSSFSAFIGEDSLTTSIKDYFEKLSLSRKEDYNSFPFEHFSLQEVSLSYLNYVSCLESLNNNQTIIFTDEQKSILYNSLQENLYHSDWTKRDNLTVVEGSGNEDFKWYLPTLTNFNNPTLEYTFAVNESVYDNLSIKIKIGEKEIEKELFKLEEEKQTEEGKVIYGFLVDEVSPLNYSDKIVTSVLNNNELVGEKVEYSFTRGLARLDIFGSDIDKMLSNALYSVAKSLYWYSSESVSYDYLPPIGDNGIYTWEIGEYTYGGKEKHIVPSAYSYFGHYVYSTGGLVDADGDSLVYEKEGFKLEYLQDNNYRMTLKGGTLDGILLNNGASLEIVVESDSVINGTLYRDWNDKNSKTSGSIISRSGNVTIKGQGKLLINGQLYIDGNLNIEEGANVEINTSKSYANGITCFGDLNVDNSSLKITSLGNGIYLNGLVDENNISLQTLSVNGDSNVVISANGYGVTSQLTNRTLKFNDGNVDIIANTGLNWSNVVVDKADVKVTARNGYTIESSSDVIISTISGDYNIGSLTLINETPYNEWWDVNYVIKPKEMNINGGTLKFEGSCRSGIIQTVEGSTFTFENCDVYIKSYQSGHGFGCDAGGSIVIENTTRVFTYDCDIPIGCWNKENPVQVTIRGDFAAVNNQGQVGTWDDSTVIVEGFIRYVTE